MPELRVSLGSLTLKNPVLVAAGTFGYGLEFVRSVRLERLGALVTKTLTRTPREGNAPPRLVETPAGMLNTVGLQNVGLEAFLREKLPQLQALQVPVIVSVLGDRPEDVSVMVQQLERAEGVAAVELNLSCPNVKVQAAHVGATAQASSANVRMGHMVAQDAEATFAVVETARRCTRKPVIAKLSPDVTDLTPIAQAAERAGADALTIGNTFTGMSLDPATRRSRLGTLTGGLSGPAIRPLAVYRVWYTAQIVHIPVIGVGGIVRADDALEFFLAGATAVAVGTANFANPSAPLQVLRGVERYLRRHRIDTLEVLRGAINRTQSPNP